MFRRGQRRIRRRTRRRVRRRILLIGGAIVLAGRGKAAAVKLSSQDAKRIEQHASMPASDLTDEDLSQAMNELGIKGQELSAEDKSALAAEGTAAKADSAPSASPAPAVPKETYLDELERLADLRDRGIISDEDFETKKRQLLGM